jgi:4-hydroxy-tetrahydrodipicolinate reductase
MNVRDQMNVIDPNKTSQKKIKLAVAGCAGRMGRLVVQEILNTSSLELVAGSVKPGSAYVNVDIGVIAGKTPLGHHTTSNPEELFHHADCIIDFSHVSALSHHLTLAATYAKPFLSAITGLTDVHHREMNKASQHTPILYTSNTSVGITLLLKLIEKAAHTLGEEFDIDIVETHHRHKQDAPSGTALALGQAIRQGHRLNTLQDYYYPLPASVPRPPATIGYCAIRGGGYPGDHRVIFSSESEVVEFTHRALNRQLYAKGAIKAAIWLIQQKPGLYSMQDVLGLVI